MKARSDHRASANCPSALRGGLTRERGYSLIEVVAVLGIIMVLATIAIYSVRQYLLYAKAAEAHEVVGSIMAGEESYFEETFRYLDVTGSNFYPAAHTVKGDVKVQWGAASPVGCTDCGTRFRTIGVNVSQPVLFRYNCQANVAGEDPADYVPSSEISLSGTPFAAVATAPRDFYVVTAASDLNGNDSDYSIVIGSSFQSDMYTENIGK